MTTTTARDEVLKAMRDAWPSAIGIGSMLDAIPGDVLVRYAIERGALKEIDYRGRRHPWVYRVMEP